MLRIGDRVRVSNPVDGYQECIGMEGTVKTAPYEHLAKEDFVYTVSLDDENALELFYATELELINEDW